ncbi:MAG: YtxH domain-containing protein [Elusimicrobia bacterium]|nr:YtxH domain-containing protein [Elusimicrobiota bacterium]
MSEKSSGNADAVLAFLIGGMIGGALGVLLTPNSGRKTRADLSKLLKKWADEGEDILDEGKERVMEETRKISSAAHAVKKAFQDS